MFGLLVMVEEGLTVKVKVLGLMAIFNPLTSSKMYPEVDTVAKLKPELGVLDGLVLPVTVTIKV